MKVIVNKSCGSFNNILEYLNYKLPDHFVRNLISVEGIDNTPKFTINEKEFDFTFNGSVINFKIIESSEFKKNFDYFFRYSELIIENESLEIIKKFISEANEYIEKNIHTFNQNTINIYTCCCRFWKKESELTLRSLDTTYIPNKVKEDILKDITFFAFSLRPDQL